MVEIVTDSQRSGYSLCLCGWIVYKLKATMVRFFFIYNSFMTLNLYLSECFTRLTYVFSELSFVLYTTSHSLILYNIHKIYAEQCSWNGHDNDYSLLRFHHLLNYKLLQAQLMRKTDNNVYLVCTYHYERHISSSRNIHLALLTSYFVLNIWSFCIIATNSENYLLYCFHIILNVDTIAWGT